MSWLLDTDVICQPAKRNGDATYWVRTKEGRQRQALQAWLTRLVDALHGRIHGFNVSVAHVWAEQERVLEKAGQRTPIEDGYIAATARRHGPYHRHRKRPGLQTSRTQGLQPFLENCRRFRPGSGSTTVQW